MHARDVGSDETYRYIDVSIFIKISLLISIYREKNIGISINQSNFQKILHFNIIMYFYEPNLIIINYFFLYKSALIVNVRIS